MHNGEKFAPDTPKHITPYMNIYQTISLILVLIGAGFMFASIIFSLKTLTNVPDSFRQRWQILTALMVFFFAGYLTFAVISLKKLNLHMEIVTGVVFFAGALFVFLITTVSRKIIAKIREGEQLLRNAKDELEIRVQQRTEELKKSNTELTQILNSAADGIRVVDKNFIMQRVNNTFAEMTGFTADELIGTPCYEAFTSPTCHTENCMKQKIFNGEKHLEHEVELKLADGTPLPCLVTAFPFYNADNELVGIVEGFRDISERKKMEDRLKEISITDELTGLLNRRGFLFMAEKQINLVDRLDKSMFLLYADIDNMKWINDNLGHSVGDEALIEAADLLRNTFRKSDTIGIGRLGGDEYAVLMHSNLEGPCCNHPVIQRIEEQIAKKNAEPDRRYTFSMSTGIAQYDTDNPCSLEEFISMGDKAMYQCKREKKKLLTD